MDVFEGSLTILDGKKILNFLKAILLFLSGRCGGKFVPLSSFATVVPGSVNSMKLLKFIFLLIVIVDLSVHMEEVKNNRNNL